MYQTYDAARYPAYIDTGTMNLEYPPLPNLAELRIHYDPQADVSLEEVAVQNLRSPSTTEKSSEEVNSGTSVSSDIFSPEQMAELIFPPIVRTKKARNKDQDGSPKLNKTSEKEDECVVSGEKEYCEYYEETKEKEYYTMYPLGRCVLPRGAVLHFTGATENMTREDVKEALVELGAQIQFIDYQRGSTEGWARLSFPYEARIIIKKMVKQKLNIAGADLDFRVLSGKDEKRYHKKAIEAIYQLQEKAKGLGKKLKKAKFNYVTIFKPDSDSSDGIKKNKRQKQKQKSSK